METLTLLAFGPYLGENVEHLLQKTHCTDRGKKQKKTQEHQRFSKDRAW